MRSHLNFIKIASAFLLFTSVGCNRDLESDSAKFTERKFAAKQKIEPELAGNHSNSAIDDRDGIHTVIFDSFNLSADGLEYVLDNSRSFYFERINMSLEAKKSDFSPEYVNQLITQT